MSAFFTWLSNPGPFEEICVMIVLLIVLGFLILMFAKFISFDYKGITSKDKNKDKNKKDSSNQIKQTITNPLASQDYRLISLIVQAHANKVKEEMKQYCKINGLDKKNRDEYMMYVDEKKNLYIAELREMFNSEYVAHDIISITEIYSIIDDTKEMIMNKLEKLYIKLRDISIQEHMKLNEEKDVMYQKAFGKAMEWRSKNLTDEEKEKTLNEMIEIFKEMCEKLVLCEHIDILTRQMQKIDMTKKELVDIILTKVVEKIEAKIETFNKE